jgi:hypothetical protein
MVGDPLCYFCKQHETVNLLFTYPVAKIIWTTIATCIGANNMPVFFIRVGNGVSDCFPIEDNFTRLELQLSVGQFRK